MSLTLASLRIYPIKSLGGFLVNEAQLTDRGLQHDRRWMLVDGEGTFVSQREVPTMACLHTAPQGDGFRVTDVRDGTTLDLPWTWRDERTLMTSVWSDRLRTVPSLDEHSRWFSSHLERPLTLVYLPDATKRHTDGRYAQSLTSLSDAFPYLIASQASLNDLNARLDVPVPMDRFRPNLVIAGGTPYQEDAWRAITIGTAHFQLVKPCARCVIVSTDQRTGERGKEPLRTLASYRSKGNKVMFGMNAVGDASGTVKVGAVVTVLS
ncbi:MAG TPA: MOSC domain-containing protein [Flavobacteriales bacterium]|nr:MOSC domain-containing protein [Flavobacteriales bacterium]